MAKFKELGIKVKDKITGFTGIITAHANYITGCDQYLVQPELENNSKWTSAEWIDEGRLDIVNNIPMIASNDVIEKEPGADVQAPIK